MGGRPPPNPKKLHREFKRESKNTGLPEIGAGGESLSVSFDTDRLLRESYYIILS